MIFRVDHTFKQRSKLYHSSDESPGFFIVSVIVTMTFMFLISLSVFNLVINNFRLAKEEQYRLAAQFAADAGIDAGIIHLNTSESWPGSGGEVAFFTDPSNEYSTTYETTASGTSIDERVLTVTGRVYVPAGNVGSPRFTRKYSVDMRGLGDGELAYGLVTGVGGLILENNAKIVAGDVHVNGTLSLSNFSQIGTTIRPLDVNVAHHSCPVGGGATYPEKCTSGDPITINQKAHIYGDVCAANQTDGSSMTNTGLNMSCADPASLPLPPHDRATQKTNIVYEAGVNTSNGLAYYTDCDTNNPSGKRTWEGQLKIDGDVYIAKGCEITVTGDVWITGKLVMENSAALIVDDSIVLGSPNTVVPDYPSIMIDSQDGVLLKNSSSVEGNSSNVGAQLVTYWSEAACSPDCATVTGQDLYDSSSVTTISLQEAAQAPNSLLYSKWSQVDMNNGGDIGALIGQTVVLRNSASVTFGITISGTGGTVSETWLVDNYRRDY